MTIWIVAVLCLALLATEGYYQGAIRAAFSLLGLLAAMVLAIPLTPLADWIFPLLGFDHPLVPQFFSPVITFFGVVAAFKGGAEFAHRKVEQRYKYHVTDAERALWNRLMQQIGLSIGVVTGAVYTLVICVVVSVLGYLTVQVGGQHSGSRLTRIVNAMAVDLQATGMHKVVAAMNPAPEMYFEVVDLFGLLYQNRLLQARLETYPPFVVMATQPEWQAIGADKEIQQQLQTEQSLTPILEHPKIQAVLTNVAIYKQLLEIDRKDLRAYLETGKSAKYDSEAILGRWHYDYPESFRLVRQNKARMASITSSQFLRLKNDLEFRHDGAVLQATCDRKASIVLPPNIENTRPPNSPSNAPPRLSLRGEWTLGARGYQLTLTDKNGRRVTCSAAVTDNRILLSDLDGSPASFVRAAP